MTLLVKRNGSLFPSMVSDFFGADDFLGTDLLDLNSAFFNQGRSWQVPSVNITENEKDFSIELAAPGLTKKDFKIEVDHEGMLTISAEKEEKKKEEEKNYTRKEFSYSSFSRSFQLPKNSVSDKLNAKYEDGVLKLSLPKKEIVVSKPKKEIKVS